jgi:hypothetical protein
MESNGKRVMTAGTPCEFETGEIDFGEVRSGLFLDCLHSFRNFTFAFQAFVDDSACANNWNHGLLCHFLIAPPYRVILRECSDLLTEFSQ